MAESPSFHVVPIAWHDQLVDRAFRARGFDSAESAGMVKICREAARHGIRTHNALKALHLDDLFGSKVGGCVPGAKLAEIPHRFAATKVWNANRKSGPVVAFKAIEECIRLADQFGVGTVSVDNAWHYLWGGGYVLEAARRGYIAYTNCTAMLAEVVPFKGRTPTLGTNPHSWAFPTTDTVEFPILIDWATSAISMGRVQQFVREGKTLPPNSAVDAAGQPTSDPNQVKALLPFGAHKGFGLGLVNELVAAYIGGSLPTQRGRFTGTASDADTKRTPCFFFQVIHPEAMSRGSQNKNVGAVVRDILSGENQNVTLPGKLEAEMAAQSDRHNGLLFTAAETQALQTLAQELGGIAPGDFREVRLA